MTIRKLGNILFTGAKQLSTLAGSKIPAAPKNYFFVDTNVIVEYRKKQFETPDLIKFIEDNTNQFLYTETVLKELQRLEYLYPESFPDNNVAEKRFRFIDSKSTQRHKEIAIDILHELWKKEFGHEKAMVAKGFGLTDEQLQKFKQDLFIIFEAGYVCYDKGVLPADDLRAPPLIMNNMMLYNKLLSRDRTINLVNVAINLAGLEHLIPVQLLDDTIDAWHLDKLQQGHGSKNKF